YGTCAACGASIAPARLLAVPTAELCLDCAGHARD
ncbi:MAG TPA: TraR/DksA C4-type zinc finger protein, partial [Pseudomonas sp.]